MNVDCNWSRFFNTFFDCSRSFTHCFNCCKHWTSGFHMRHIWVDCALVSCWKQVTNGNMRSWDCFFHTWAGHRGQVGMNEQWGTNGEVLMEGWTWCQVVEWSWCWMRLRLLLETSQMYWGTEQVSYHWHEGPESHCQWNDNTNSRDDGCCCCCSY